jgi:hypothetical protein
MCLQEDQEITSRGGLLQVCRPSTVCITAKPFYLIAVRPLLFPVGISPCPVLSAILSQPFLRSSRYGHRDLASPLSTDHNRSGMNSFDMITLRAVCVGTILRHPNYKLFYIIWIVLKTELAMSIQLFTGYTVRCIATATTQRAPNFPSNRVQPEQVKQLVNKSRRFTWLPAA